MAVSCGVSCRSGSDTLGHGAEELYRALAEAAEEAEGGWENG